MFYNESLHHLFEVILNWDYFGNESGIKLDGYQSKKPVTL